MPEGKPRSDETQRSPKIFVMKADGVSLLAFLQQSSLRNHHVFKRIQKNGMKPLDLENLRSVAIRKLRADQTFGSELGNLLLRFNPDVQPPEQ